MPAWIFTAMAAIGAVVMIGGLAVAGFTIEGLFEDTPVEQPVELGVLAALAGGAMIIAAAILSYFMT